MEESNKPVNAQAAEQRELHLVVQTPRGVWDQHNPPRATKKPLYRSSALVQQVIDDVRSVFGFIEQDNVYTLLLHGKPLEPHQTLLSVGIADGAVLVLTVQGGNA